MAVVGLPCCMWAFSSCGEQGYSLGVVRGLLVAERGLSCMGSVVEFPGSRAQAQ